MIKKSKGRHKHEYIEINQNILEELIEETPNKIIREFLKDILEKCTIAENLNSALIDIVACEIHKLDLGIKLPDDCEDYIFVIYEPKDGEPFMGELLLNINTDCIIEEIKFGHNYAGYLEEKFSERLE